MQNAYDFEKMDQNRFQKIDFLGKGSFGKTFIVRSNVSKNLYVLKELQLDSWSHFEKDQNFNEVRILSNCRHPNIIAYKEAFITHDKCLLSIVMEFAEKGDLSKIIKHQREVLKEYFEESKIMTWLVQLIFALDYLHSLNILHRDLKCQNIFLTSQDVIKLGDFGISKSLEHTFDLAQTAIGTPHYLSPEICQQLPYNHKSDMWSLGCVLYELCALKHPFSAHSLNELVNQIVRSKYRLIPKHYGQNLGDFVSVLLKANPERRPSAKMLIRCKALEKYVNKYLENIRLTKHSYKIFQSSNESPADN